MKQLHQLKSSVPIRSFNDLLKPLTAAINIALNTHSLAADPMHLF